MAVVVEVVLVFASVDAASASTVVVALASILLDKPTCVRLKVWLAESDEQKPQVRSQ